MCEIDFSTYLFNYGTSEIGKHFACQFFVTENPTIAMGLREVYHLINALCDCHC